MMPRRDQTVFDIHRWTNPACFHDYPLIAVAEDRSVFMSLGDYGLCFEWQLSASAESALSHDFALVGEQLSCDFSTLREVFSTVFSGGVKRGLVRFDAALRPHLVELTLHNQVMAEDGPEYLIYGLRDYRRQFREPLRVSAVSLAECAMLDLCFATFAELATQCGTRLKEPPPPRYRRT